MSAYNIFKNILATAFITHENQTQTKYITKFTYSLLQVWNDIVADSQYKLQKMKS